MGKPDYDVIVGDDRGDGQQKKTFWTNIGAAWEKDNGSISVMLRAHPLGNQILLVKPRPKGETEANARSSQNRSQKRGPSEPKRGFSPPRYQPEEGPASDDDLPF